jgi:hypothetical protein
MAMSDAEYERIVESRKRAWQNKEGSFGIKRDEDEDEDEDDTPPEPVPEEVAALKEKGNEAYNERHFQEAIDVRTQPASQPGPARARRPPALGTAPCARWLHRARFRSGAAGADRASLYSRAVLLAGGGAGGDGEARPAARAAHAALAEPRRLPDTAGGV